MFRRQAKATPDKTAVVYKDKRFTYAQLDDMSDRIAGYIASKGLGREDIVAVLIPRSEWMAIASLGVIKAGCAFQPLDPTYPKERLNFMMQDTGARLLIADEELRPIVDEYQGDVIFTKDLVQLPAVGTLPEGPKPDSLFTLVYTSGSTGVPKGAMLTHRGLIMNVQEIKESPGKTWTKALSWLPMCHIYERMMGYLYQWLCFTIAYAESIAKVGDNCKEISPNMMACVPRFIEKVYDKIYRKGEKMSGIGKKIFNWYWR